MPTEGRRHGSDERWTIYVCGCGAVGGNPSFERAVPCGRRSDGFHDAEPIIVEPVPPELSAENERRGKALEQIDAIEDREDLSSIGQILDEVHRIAKAALHPTEETEGEARGQRNLEAHGVARDDPETSTLRSDIPEGADSGTASAEGPGGESGVPAAPQDTVDEDWPDEGLDRWNAEPWEER